MFDFSEEELLRYSRHILLQDVGVEGQEKIKWVKFHLNRKLFLKR